MPRCPLVAPGSAGGGLARPGCPCGGLVRGAPAFTVRRLETGGAYRPGLIPGACIMAIPRRIHSGVLSGAVLGIAVAGGLPAAASPAFSPGDSRAPAGAALAGAVRPPGAGAGQAGAAAKLAGAASAARSPKLPVLPAIPSLPKYPVFYEPPENTGAAPPELCPYHGAPCEIAGQADVDGDGRADTVISIFYREPDGRPTRILRVVTARNQAGEVSMMADIPDTVLLRPWAHDIDGRPGKDLLMLTSYISWRGEHAATYRIASWIPGEPRKPGKLVLLGAPPSGGDWHVKNYLAQIKGYSVSWEDCQATITVKEYKRDATGYYEWGPWYGTDATYRWKGRGWEQVSVEQVAPEIPSQEDYDTFRISDKPGRCGS